MKTMQFECLECDYICQDDQSSDKRLKTRNIDAIIYYIEYIVW